LRIGKKVKLTGGPYVGDIGTCIKKSEDGHYCFKFENSVNETFGIKRRPFTLWMGSWWLEMATHGKGIVPGGKIPIVPVSEDDVLNGEEQPSEKDTKLDLEKYMKMKKCGLPEAAIRQKMYCDGVSESEIENFFA
jgi:hypothetical protein